LQTEPPPPSEARSNSESTDAQRLRVQYRANTNLEQISDWLTKILVGVGLTQLTLLPDLFDRAGSYFGVAIGPSEIGSRIAVAIILFFSISGFLFGYLWTRLFLGSELARADLNAISESVREIKEAQEEQAQIDAKAISLVNQYLTAADTSKISVNELRKAIEQASPPVKVSLFYRARETRSQSWQRNEDKPLLERTVPIFEALVASDKERRFHQNFGQLGFALKDKRSPDYARAEAMLTTAIELRGPPDVYGWEIYELNRAVCTILLDPQFGAGRPSEPDVREKIIKDLKAAAEGIPDLFRHQDILKWLQLNQAKDDFFPR
jgi:hypothetical protein